MSLIWECRRTVLPFANGTATFDRRNAAVDRRYGHYLKVHQSSFG
ncbi:hypothetical protein T11_13283 [Trichinella zimbabwensis]|uniref:Uncharacterized protein n=1 Tax=Trichinella zimbabwensis TaxID=268475 RepID=A0A0V1GWC8_9BILA|nr:hypothetical protein T11_13283 [Trichinella zimbabwensis]